MNSLSAFYLAEKMIRNGAPLEDMEQVIVLLKDEINKLKPHNVLIVSPRSTIEVNNIVIEILAYLQGSFNKDYAPQMLTLCMAYFRLDPDMVDFLLSFYSKWTQPIEQDTQEPVTKRGKRKSKKEPQNAV